MIVSPEFEHLWKTFGASTTAGRLLREIYDPTSHVRASKTIQYPKLTAKTANVAEATPKVEKPTVAVPKFRKPLEPRDAKAKSCGRKPARQILWEITAMAADKDVSNRPLVDRELERRRLQEKFQFSQATCLPHSIKMSGSNMSSVQPPRRRLAEKDRLLQGLIEQIKEDQTRLEQWAEDVETLDLRGANPRTRQKVIEEKQLEQLQLRNKISEAIRDIKVIVDCN